MPSADASIAPLHPADKKKAGPVLRFCSRCRVNRSTILVQSASYCPDCFQFTFEGKVRQGLEQSRLCTYLHRTEGETSKAGAQASTSRGVSEYPCQGRIAIGFSGGAASRVLLHLAKDRLLPDPNHRRGGKVQEIRAIDVIYVDDSEVIEDVEDRTEQVRAIVEEEGGEEAGLFFKAVKLQSIFEDNQGVHCTAASAGPRYLTSRAEVIANQQEALSQLFQSIQPHSTPKGMLPNTRSRIEDLLSLFTTHLLRSEAIRSGASCLLTGETSTRMAVKLIDSIGKGQGHKLPLEQSAIRWHGLFILKPMKEVSRKEVAFYSRQESLSSLAPFDITATQLLSLREGISTGSNGDKASMGRLTESLIHLLEKNVASTVSTITKAGDKLVFSDEAAAHDDIEEGLDVNASSSTAFHQVGPSVSLRHRKRQESTSTQMSRLSLSSSLPPQANGTTVGDPGDRTLQGLGLGRMGSALYFAAQKMMHYNGELACPLCQLPSQRGLHAWKRGLTVQSTRGNDQEIAKQMPQNDKIDLTDYLCYACSIVLDTPENVPECATMTLPSFVLQGVQDRIEEEDLSAGTTLNGDMPAELKIDKDDIEDRRPISHIESNERARQKVERSEMKRHLNGFLLNDEEEVQTPPIQQERQQMDW